MTLSNLRRLWSFWRFCFAELFGELKSKVAPSILRSLGDGVTLGTPRDLFARLAGRLNRVVNFTVNSNAIRICVICQWASKKSWMPRFSQGSRSNTYNPATDYHLRSNSTSSAEHRKKTIPDLEGKNWWSNSPIFEWSNHVKTCRCPENDVKSCDIRIRPCLQPLIHWGIVQDKHQVPLPGGAAGNRSSRGPSFWHFWHRSWEDKSDITDTRPGKLTVCYGKSPCHHAING